MDAAATVENAIERHRPLGKKRWAFPTVAVESAARFPQRPQASFSKTQSGETPGWKEGFVSGGYGKRSSAPSLFEAEARRLAPGNDNDGVSHSLAHKKTDEM
jgi:hypothetical protein